MRRFQSISFRLSIIFLSFFFLIIVLGFFGIGRLGDINLVSSDLGEVWLPKTQFLGDLNNYTSDFRAAEATRLLAPNSSERANAERDMAQLEQSISIARRNYEMIPHSSIESELYSDFTQRWTKYRNIVDHESDLVHSGQASEATVIYMTASRSAYDAASDALGQLTDRSVTYARAATTRVNETYRQARWLISAAMLFAAGMTAAAFLYVKGFLSRPLLHLSGVMHRLAANDTSTEIQDTQKRDEIGEMARAAVVFRANAIELMRTQRGLAREASMLAETLSNEQKISRAQRNFVSMASHEFRTPLTIVDALAQRLIKTKGKASSEQIVDRAERIRRAVFRMTTMIDSLLNSSRLMDHEPSLDFHPITIDIRPILREVCQLHREIAPGSNIIEDFDSISAKVTGDPKLLFQMFSNLVGNAIKYSPAGSPITVRGVGGTEFVTIDIQDKGVGIPNSEMKGLFQLYSRGSNVSGIVGSGLGLYIVKMVADLHSAEIVVESAEGKGSRFSVRLRSCESPRSDDPSLVRTKPMLAS